MRLQGVKSLEIEQGFDQALAGGIAVGDGEKVGADGHAEGGVMRGEVEKSLADDVAGKIGMRKARRQPVADRLLQGRMVQHAGGEKAAEFRLTPQGRLGVDADLREDRIGIAVMQLPHLADGRHETLLPRERIFII